MVNNRRKYRLKAMGPVVDFLEEYYDCDCPRVDPDGSHNYEAIVLIEVVLDAISDDLWDDGAREALDSLAEARYSESTNPDVHMSADAVLMWKSMQYPNKENNNE